MRKLLCLFCLLLLPVMARNCTSDLECEDANICTIDSCENNECVYEILRDCCLKHSDCNDNNPNTIDTCVDHICAFTSDIECEIDHDCDDSDPDSTDRCVNQICKYTFIEQEPGPAIMTQPEYEEPSETSNGEPSIITVINQLISTLKGILNI